MQALKLLILATAYIHIYCYIHMYFFGIQFGILALTRHTYYISFPKLN